MKPKWNKLWIKYNEILSKYFKHFEDFCRNLQWRNKKKLLYLEEYIKAFIKHERDLQRNDVTLEYLLKVEIEKLPQIEQYLKLHQKYWKIAWGYKEKDLLKWESISLINFFEKDLKELELFEKELNKIVKKYNKVLKSEQMTLDRLLVYDLNHLEKYLEIFQQNQKFFQEEEIPLDDFLFYLWKNVQQIDKCLEIFCKYKKELKSKKMSFQDLMYKNSEKWTKVDKYLEIFEKNESFFKTEKMCLDHIFSYDLENLQILNQYIDFYNQNKEILNTVFASILYYELNGLKNALIYFKEYKKLSNSRELTFYNFLQYDFEKISNAEYLEIFKKFKGNLVQYDDIDLKIFFSKNIDDLKGYLDFFKKYKKEKKGVYLKNFIYQELKTLNGFWNLFEKNKEIFLKKICGASILKYENLKDLELYLDFFKKYNGENFGDCVFEELLKHNISDLEKYWTFYEKHKQILKSKNIYFKDFIFAIEMLMNTSLKIIKLWKFIKN